MVTDIKNYSTTAGSNNSPSPNGFPEGMPPSGVNDSARQVMAAIRTWYEEAEWVDYGHSGLTFIDGTNFRVNTDLTSIYTVGRRIRATGTTPFVRYGTITASSFSSPSTTITVLWDSGIIDNTLSAIALGTQVTNSPISFNSVNFPDRFGEPPAGAIFDYAGSSAPSGYLFCYGQEVSRATYSALFSAIGETYGSGDESTTFNLPDLRGRVVAGQDNMGGNSAERLTNQSGGLDGDTLGATGGLEAHTLTEAQIAPHDHNNGVGDRTAGEGGQDYPFIYGITTDDVPGQATSQPTDNIGTVEVQGLTSEEGGGEAHNNVQPTIILNKIIKT